MIKKESKEENDKIQQSCGEGEGVRMTGKTTFSKIKFLPFREKNILEKKVEFD